MIRLGWDHSIPLAQVREFVTSPDQKRLYARTDTYLWRIVTWDRFVLAIRSLKGYWYGSKIQRHRQ